MSHVTGCQKIRVPAAVIMVNWNSPRDTIESIESTLEIAPTDKVIVVVDNNSADLSADTIYNHFFKNGTSILSVDVCDISRADSSEVPKIILIRNDKNAGYAGGNNIAIKYILDHFSTDYIWLLNNDAVVDSSSLTEMLRLADSNPRLGFVGSVIRYYDQPDTIQCFGGGFIYPFLGIAKLYLKNTDISKLLHIRTKTPDYIMGASLLVRTDLIQDIGLMSEDYFMYYEEGDWQLRARSAGWKLAVASSSFVFHKDSGSTAGAPHYFFYYLNRAAVIYSFKNYSRIRAMATSISLLFIALIKGIRNPSAIKPSFLGIIDGLKGATGEKKW